MRRSSGLLALATSLLLAFAGVLTAPVAVSAAEGVGVTPSIVDATSDGLTLQVDFTGVQARTGKDGVYVALTERGAQTPIGTGQWIPGASMPAGAGSGSYAISASALDRGKLYDALVWYAHGAPTADTIIAQAPVEISESQWDAVFPSEVDPPTDPADPEDPSDPGDPPTDPGDPTDPPTEPTTTGSLEWGVKASFVNYIEKLSGDGKVTLTDPATRKGAAFGFPQSSDESWDAGARTGAVQFSGAVSFTAHGGVLSFGLANPKIVVTSATAAQLVVTSGGSQVALADLDLAGGTVTELPGEGGGNGDGAGVRWSAVPATLTEAGVPVFQQYPAGTELDPVTFTIAASADVDPVDPPVVKPPKKPKPVKPGKPSKTSSSRAAGSLAWGVSSGFAAYTTGDIAKGTISTSGVGRSGGRYLFPQATGGDWNFASETGTVRYSGVITFSGHRGLMNESFANPVITVTSASSGTISAGGRTFGLGLSAATKTVSSGGAVTWSDVPVTGAITGGGSSGGSSGGGSFGLDPLTFTVGAASANAYGSSKVSHPSLTHEPAAAPPATTGIRVTTPKDEIVAGGEIEFEAPGFESGERDILVVIYSKPIVLDRNGGADENGVVHWIGTLPKDLRGEHTITAQGSTDAGVVIDILSQAEYDALHAPEASAGVGGDDGSPVQAAGVAPNADAASWELWAGALALVVLAAGMTGLVVVQRRRRAA